MPLSCELENNTSFRFDKIAKLRHLKLGELRTKPQDLRNVLAFWVHREYSEKQLKNDLKALSNKRYSKLPKQNICLTSLLFDNIVVPILW